MNITGIPTDSLYKWMALSGITFAIASTSIFLSKVYEYKESIIEHQAELEFISSATQLGAVFGTITAVTGFSLWYFKLQKHIDIEQAAKAEEQQIKTQMARIRLNQEKNNAAQIEST
ncbi:hypothetical protein [Alkalimarinus sediminis]|uniref:Uncharacterized protein n=1 Tax=Alkalimarinus sediminis TaxID=1632866 RepID=A0A9E8HLK1_9ALTE|nr:hypothetical protein [Alkalimarinus sediminis]UZW76352.1 hypothetical protein NNL22_07135 [Alkalimarinus sediminis]